MSSSVPGGQPPRGVSVAGLVASGQREHRLSPNPLGLRQEVRHGDGAAVLQRYTTLLPLFMIT